VFQDRTRSAKRQMKHIMQTARQHGEAAAARMKSAYRRLLAVARASVGQAQRVSPELTQHGAAATGLSERLQQCATLLARVLNQTERRVLDGEPVPAEQKTLSIFEPHTALIRKGKAGRPVEFGRVLWLNEVEGGIISDYQVLPGNPKDNERVRPSLDHHRTLFGKPPRLLAGDRGTYSASNESYAQALGVHQVVLPKPGAKSANRISYEQQRWFRRGHDWRAGIEGRISGLKRRHKLARCLNHGEAGMERWVGWGVLAHDLRMIAQATAARA
jgi:transposase, IS5 family